MKYYSTELGKLFDTQEALETAEVEAQRAAAEAEAKAKQLKETRAMRAKEVEDAYAEVRKAQKAADELLQKFIKDYGSYHTTIKEVAPNNIWDWFFNW